MCPSIRLQLFFSSWAAELGIYPKAFTAASTFSRFSWDT